MTDDCNPNCTSDSDCTIAVSATFPKAYCSGAHHILEFCGCFTGCVEDADCGPGSVCVCGYEVGQAAAFGMCVPANCATNADCGAGLACVGTPTGTAGGACNWTTESDTPPITQFVCETAQDGCRGAADCAEAGTWGLPDGSVNATSNVACLLDGTHRACGLFCSAIP